MYRITDDVYRHNFDTDLSSIQIGENFPSQSCVLRNLKYKFMMNLYDGGYARDKYIGTIVNNRYINTPYKTIPTFKFETVINKLDSLMFCNDIKINTGDIERDKKVEKLINNTNWMDSIRRAVKMAEIYGDSYIKTYRQGVSVIEPFNAFKVVDSNNKQEVKYYVLHQIIYDKNTDESYIRFILSSKGMEYEKVNKANNANYGGGCKIGENVKYKIGNRWISKLGNKYDTNINDCETVQCISVNTLKNEGVYGTSALEPIYPLVFAIENRYSTENSILDVHGKPMLLVSSSMVMPDESTGGYKLRKVDDNYMVIDGADVNKPAYLTWDGKLDNSENLRNALLEEFYSLTEMGKTFLSGDYKERHWRDDTSNKEIFICIM